jgi:hypothetical protein
MKPEKLYQELKLLAEKLGLQVSEQNFRITGIHVNSGICKVKDQDHCLINKHLKLKQKVEVLAECIAELPHESIFVVPAIRDYLEQFKPLDERVTAAENEDQIKKFT